RPPARVYSAVCPPPALGSAARHPGGLRPDHALRGALQVYCGFPAQPRCGTGARQSNVGILVAVLYQGPTRQLAFLGVEPTWVEHGCSRRGPDVGPDVEYPVAGCFSDLEQFCVRWHTNTSRLTRLDGRVVWRVVYPGGVPGGSVVIHCGDCPGNTPGSGSF